MFVATLGDILHNDEGATMVEYSIMVAFIAAVCIAVVTVFGKNVSNQFSTINSSF